MDLQIVHIFSFLIQGFEKPPIFCAAHSSPCETRKNRIGTLFFHELIHRFCGRVFSCPRHAIIAATTGINEQPQ
ncbi:hypothetical protein [Maritimibacter sp. UBA3975]|uniref:hypothetical protein n=1 Tax=Maritimibacter sp. UBA3975 TaxID=1946833 RepID=UPI0025B81E82|nr:hypothetical protein [Maritimibacter sp. UBA3975]